MATNQIGKELKQRRNCARAAVLFLAQGEPPLLAAKQKGENIPIVVVPIEKLVGSLCRPGGNATGFTCVSSDLVASASGCSKPCFRDL